MKKIQRYMQATNTSNQGFTIIEVMIGLAVLSIGVLAIMTMQISSANGNRKSGEISEAISLGTAELERLLALPYVVLTDTANDPSQDINTGAGNKFNVVSQLTIDTPIASTTTVTVNVTWNPVNSAPRTITLSSVKADLNM